MTRQLYELEHPLYPHKDLKKYHEERKVVYFPYQGSMDAEYNNWYQIVRADHDISGAPIRPIYREIQQIIRFRSSGKDKILISENLIGFDHENNPFPFFHTWGSYVKPYFRTVYNYDTKTANTIRSGQNEVVFFLDFSKELLDRFYEAGPDDTEIELLVNAGGRESKQYGGKGFFTYEEFRDLSIEDLARLGRTGKGMFTAATANVPMATLINQLGAEGTTINDQNKLYQEFLEFQRFKNQQLQPQKQTPIPASLTSTATDESKTHKFTIKSNEKKTS